MLLPEWHPQWGVMIAWPHQDTDWRDILDDADRTYQALAQAILDYQHLLVICRDAAHEQHIRALLGQVEPSRLHFRQLPFNDTWARDFGPLTVRENGQLIIRDFIFNGWGNKFDAALDNAITGQLKWQVPVEPVSLVLEGGAVEINSRGQLLTTRYCLLNPNRNPHLDEGALVAHLQQTLGVTEVLWLAHGDLEGDDTDAHIDTLARFCDDDTLAYVQCEDESDSHFAELNAMEKELEAIATEHSFRLVPLPLPAAQFDDDGNRLPITYANFLIINGAVLVPTYDCDTDPIALERLQAVFPDRKVIGIPCRTLTIQHGSLHCVTMQLPQGII